MLYADDIVLLSDPASDLRRMLGEVQRFSDESPFQFSLDKKSGTVFRRREACYGDLLEYSYMYYPGSKSTRFYVLERLPGPPRG